MRAVLTTAGVAALGFLPMAYSNTAGSEVQKPLATVVVVGILIGTIITLTAFPGLLRILLKGDKSLMVARIGKNPAPRLFDSAHENIA